MNIAVKFRMNTIQDRHPDLPRCIFFGLMNGLPDYHKIFRRKKRRWLCRRLMPKKTPDESPHRLSPFPSKSTTGTFLAPSSAWKYGLLSKRKKPAMRFSGNTFIAEL